jgi:hypothetical protein
MHNLDMAALFFVIAVIAVCVLAASYGKDSRFDDRGYHRTNF